MKNVFLSLFVIVILCSFQVRHLTLLPYLPNSYAAVDMTFDDKVIRDLGFNVKYSAGSAAFCYAKGDNPPADEGL